MRARSEYELQVLQKHHNRRDIFVQRLTTTENRHDLEKIVTDLINALPGSSSVNTVQHATMEESVFSMRRRHAKKKEDVFSMR
jgi:predicted site-specific integrase-resolvase